MELLNDAERLTQGGAGDMFRMIESFSQAARTTLTKPESPELKEYRRPYKSLIVSAMGGSAMGGLLLRDWLWDTSRIPITVSRGYKLPAWADPDTLVYAVSYSGGTEETLNQFSQAIKKECPVICFTSDGKLGEHAATHGLPVHLFPGGYYPRAAIAFQFFSIAKISHMLGIVNEEAWSQVDEAINVVEALIPRLSPESPLEVNPAKQLAKAIQGYIPFIYSESKYRAVAYRYGTQFNENSKSPSASSFIPEAYHNSIMASEAAPEMLERLCAVIIRDPQEDAGQGGKITLFKDLLSKSFGRVIDVTTIGDGLLARMLSALIVGDYASVYLSVIYGRDPTSTDSINTLKSRTPRRHN